ncbi:hypothetical protein [Brumimicrobium mesophilum]|uniref:hypothetical protein n=1 Tax=Brumimicrobium mesophilum TaxID=392717 RepID=UPI00131A8CA0|nr:hypothetical protein [Brumimicrobium mesophilum]
MRHLKTNITPITVAFFVSLLLVILGHVEIEQSLHVYSPFPVSLIKFWSMIILYLFVSTSFLSLVFIPIFKIISATEYQKKSEVLKKYKYIVYVLAWSTIIKLALYVAQFTGIKMLFELSMSLNLHMDWYFGSDLNYFYHLFAFEVIFMIVHGIYFLKRKLS